MSRSRLWHRLYLTSNLGSLCAIANSSSSPELIFRKPTTFAAIGSILRTAATSSSESSGSLLKTRRLPPTHSAEQLLYQSGTLPGLHLIPVLPYIRYFDAEMCAAIPQPNSLARQIV